MKDERKQTEETRYELGQESLFSRDYFNCEKWAKDIRTEFESESNMYYDKLKSATFKQPRMFTIMQIRDMFHALLHQS